MPRGMIVLAVVLFLFSLGISQAAVISVPYDYQTIQDAIDASLPGDEIAVEPGTYVENIDFKGKDVYLHSRHGPSVTIIDGGGSGSVVVVSTGEGPGAVIEGFTIRNGNNTRGGGIRCRNTSCVIRGNIIRDNTAMDGGGIHCWKASPLIEANRITGNSAWKGGGIHCYDHSSPLIVNNMIDGNEVGGHGAGICCWSYSSPVITNNTITANASGDKGGGIECIIASDPVVTNTILWNDTAREGPEIWVGYVSFPSTMTISHCDVLGGQSSAHVEGNCVLAWGAGMIDGDPLFSDAEGFDWHLTGFSPCRDAGDNAAPSLPATDFDGDPRVLGGTADMGADEFFEGGTITVPGDYPAIQTAVDAAVDGDVVEVDAGTYMENIDFSGKAITVRSLKGALKTVIDGGQAGTTVSFTSGEGPDSVLEGFTVTNGSSGTDGGGILCRDSSPVIKDNIVTANTAMNGGGIACWTSDAVISGNRIEGNSAWKGGGFFCYGPAYPLVVNNQILNNHADSYGGGICCWNRAFCVITNDTVAGNVSDGDGGGFYCTLSSHPRVADTILWGNTAREGKAAWIGSSQNPSTVDFSYSDVEGGQSGVFVGSNCILNWGAGMIDADPDFIDPGAAPLHIRGGSPCADAGENAAPGIQERDFEGDPRINNSVVDIGADELYAGKNVFIMVVDGLRSSEGFDDPSHQYIPHIWNDLVPLGAICTDMLNMGFTVTTPSHQTLTSGVNHFGPNCYLVGYDDVHRVQEEPSIFQYYRAQLGVAKEKTWIVDGKGIMLKYTGICLNPAYRQENSPYVSFEVSQPDDTTLAELKAVIAAYHPSLTLINFKEVDNTGHTGSWTLHTDAILHADTVVYDACQTIWQDPYYDGNTTIIIVSDHGRHLDGISTGFKDHGCSCMGCRKIPFLAIGPGIKTNAVIQGKVHEDDIAPTVGAILGFKVKYGRGRVLREIFENPPPEDPPSLIDPAAAWGGGKVHAVATREYQDKTQILYADTSDNGNTWKNINILSSTDDNLAPSVAAEGDNVAVAWSGYQTNGYCKVFVRQSADGGATWGDKIEMNGSWGTHADVYTDVKYRNGALTVVWTEMAMGQSRVHLARIQGSTVEDDSFEEFHVLGGRCAPVAGGAHVVYQSFKPTEKNWDISYCFHDTTAGWGTPVPISETPGESLRPDIAVDSTGIHVVWAEEDGGYFRILARNSQDGVTWNGPFVAAEIALGAWHPRLAAASDRLVLVFEGYEGKSPSIFSSQSTDGGVTWSAPVNESGSESDDIFPSLCIDSADMMHLFWMKGPAPMKLGRANVQIR